MNQTTRLTEELKQRWMSAFEMQLYLKSSSADRLMRFIRKNPPTGFEVIQRKKEVEGYTTCNEYFLKKI